jgi:hypothetical protein
MVEFMVNAPFISWKLKESFKTEFFFEILIFLTFMRNQNVNEIDFDVVNNFKFAFKQIFC